MAVRIGSARIDESGRAAGGKAGDQTGKEVSAQNWYRHAKGWVVLRAKNAEKAGKIAACMRAACANGHIGYDQTQRNTLYDAAKPLGFDVRKVEKDVETDCSALVRVCCLYAGIAVGDFYTGNQVAKLTATGEFVKLEDRKYTESDAYLKTGDILVTRTKGHTVVVLGDGAQAEGGPESSVTVTGGSVNLRMGPGTQYAVCEVVHRGDALRGVEGWIPVWRGGEVRWISRKYAEEEAK